MLSPQTLAQPALETLEAILTIQHVHNTIFGRRMILSVCRKSLVCVIIFGLATAWGLLTVSCADAAEKYGDLRSWVNKYPSDVKDSKNFFQAPEIASALSELLPPKEYELLTHTYAVEIPIETVGDYLLVSKCMPHCCPCENVLLIVGLRDNSLLALFWNQVGQSTRCFSTGPRVADLPDAVKEKYLEMHIVRMTKDEKLLPKNAWLNKIECEKKKTGNP